MIAQPNQAPDGANANANAPANVNASAGKRRILKRWNWRSWFRGFTIRLGLSFGLMAVPYVILFVVGWLWLVEHGYAWHWFFLAILLTTAGYWLCRLITRAQIRAIPESAQPSQTWGKVGSSAWGSIEAIERRIDRGELVVDSPERAAELVQDVLRVVASQFHPRSAQPELDAPISEILTLVERVTADVREIVVKNVPGSHIFTVNDLRKVGDFANFGKNAYDLYRVASFAVNPARAAIREASSSLSSTFFNPMVDEIRKSITKVAVRRAAGYAIDLYSGQLVRHDPKFQEHVAAPSLSDAQEERKRETILAGEPFRVVVLGQTKSGKSSLINALFGEVKAATDVVPRTRAVTPYVLEEEGRPTAILLDTAGFEEGNRLADALGAARSEAVKSDVILLVCTAMTAARGPDRRLLDDLRAMFQQEPDRELPPILVVLTHVDQLRPFAEWEPPYDLSDESRPKAKNIKAARDAAAADLAIPADRVIPVCLAHGREWNVSESLYPALEQVMESDGQRLRLQRALKDYARSQKLRMLGEQAVNSGKLIGAAALDIAGKVAKQFVNDLKK